MSLALAMIVGGLLALFVVTGATLAGCDGISLGNVFLGSVASKVIHLSHVPVTLIR